MTGGRSNMSRCLSIDDDGPGGARGGISAVEPTMHQDLLNDDNLKGDGFIYGSPYSYIRF